MATLKSKNNTEFIISCCDGCDEGIMFRAFEDDFDYYCIMTYTNGHFYALQDESMWRVFCKKLKKIWAIIANKDHYYSEIIMTKEDFNEFKEYINNI